MIQPKVLFTASIAVLVISLATLLITFGYTGYPLPGADAVAFIPTAIQFKQGLGLVNEIYDLPLDIGLQTGYRFVYYVPLFPVVLSLLMQDATPQSAFVGIAVLNSLTLAICAFLFYRIALAASPRRTLSGFGFLMVCLCLIGMGSRFTGQNDGRPEALATLLIAIACLLPFFFRHRSLYLPILLGLLLGLMGATQAWGAVVFAFLIGGYFSLFQKGKDFLKSLGMVYSVSLVCFLIVLLLASPYGIMETLLGTKAHAAYQSENAFQRYGMLPPLKDLVHYYFLKSRMTFYGLVAIFSAVSGFYWWRHYQGQIALPICLGLFATGIFALVYMSCVRTPFSSYNLFLFTPVLFGVCLYTLLHLTQSETKYRTLLQTTGLLMLSLTTIGFIWTTLAFPGFLQHGMSLQQARQVFREVESTTDRPIGISRTLWVLSENYQQMFIYEGPQTYPKVSGHKYSNALLVKQQNYLDFKPADAIDNHPLQRHFFVQHKPRLFGIPIESTPPGYQFAVYHPKNNPLAK